MIPDRRIYIVTCPHLEPLRSFLEHSPLRKLVFDCRGLCDVLHRQFKFNLANVWDLQIIEAVVRGNVSTRTKLPVKAIQKGSKIHKVVLKDRVFTEAECCRFYIDGVSRDYDNDNVPEFYNGHFEFLLRFSNILIGTRAGNSNFLPTDMEHLSIVSHRYSRVNSGKTFRNGDMYDSHDLIYDHIIARSSVLSVVQCFQCHVTQPVEGFDNTNLYSNYKICKTCHVLKEEKSKSEVKKKKKWRIF